MRDKDADKIKAKVARQVKTKEAKRKAWDDLKRAGADALKASGHRAPSIKPGSHAFGGQVVNQEDDVKDISETGFRNFTEWQDEQPEDVTRGYKDPDSFSEEDGYFQTRSAIAETDPLAATVSAELYKMLGNVLTKRQLEIYNLHIERGLAHADIAAILGTDRQNIGHTWERIEKTLREHFAKIAELRKEDSSNG